MPSTSTAESLVSWLRTRDDCTLEKGLSDVELRAAEAAFGITWPPSWRAVLARVHPIALPEPPTDPDGWSCWVRWPDWRLRDVAGTRQMISQPIEGLLADVVHGFWWHAWGGAPTALSQRVALAREQLATVPKLVPLRGHWYATSSDDDPVFDLVLADVWIPALTLADLATGADQTDLPIDAFPIGRVPFWSELSAYSARGHDDGGGPGPFAHLGTGGL